MKRLRAVDVLGKTNRSRSRKPEGLGEFRQLLGQLSQVPKKELDAQVAKHKKKAAKRKK
jgi:hypothetical protein